jgi:hypothetical protein
MSGLSKAPDGILMEKHLVCIHHMASLHSKYYPNDDCCSILTVTPMPWLLSETCTKVMSFKACSAITAK